jgi:hypothetical protein
MMKPTFLAALIVALSMAPAFAQSPAPASLDGQYIGTRVASEALIACRNAAGSRVILNVAGGKISSQLSPKTTAPVDDSGNFTFDFDADTPNGTVTFTYAGQIVGTTAKGTIHGESLKGDCRYTFSAVLQAPKK